jgi:serine protease SohB
MLTLVKGRHLNLFGSQASRQLPPGLKDLIQGETDKDPLDQKQFEIISLNDLRAGAMANIQDGIQGRHVGEKLRKQARRKRLGTAWLGFLETLDANKRDDCADALSVFQDKEISRHEQLKNAMESWRNDVASKHPSAEQKDPPFYQRWFQSKTPEQNTTAILAKQLKNESELMRKLQLLGIDVSVQFNSVLKGSTSAMDLATTTTVEKGDDTGGSQQENGKATIFVLDFKGDTAPTQVQAMKEEITAILTLPTKPDEVILRLYSGGGSAYGYGLAATELKRLQRENIALTVCVDEVAASGGYMMACVADHVVASPWSILGSVGVISGMPNAAERLDREGLKFYKMTAGKHKNNIDPFTAPTAEGLKQHQIDLERVLHLFKKHVEGARGERLKRPIEEIANGDVWQGIDALEVGLVDELMTSEELIGKKIAQGSDLWTLKKMTPKKGRSPLQKLFGQDATMLKELMLLGMSRDGLLEEQMNGMLEEPWNSTMLERHESTLPQLK